MCSNRHASLIAKAQTYYEEVERSLECLDITPSRQGQYYGGKHGVETLHQEDQTSCLALHDTHCPTLISMASDYALGCALLNSIKVAGRVKELTCLATARQFIIFVNCSLVCNKLSNITEVTLQLAVTMKHFDLVVGEGGCHAALSQVSLHSTSVDQIQSHSKYSKAETLVLRSLARHLVSLQDGSVCRAFLPEGGISPDLLQHAECHHNTEVEHLPAAHCVGTKQSMIMQILHTAEEYTTCIQVDLMQDLQKCSIYREQNIRTGGPTERMEFLLVGLIDYGMACREIEWGNVQRSGWSGGGGTTQAMCLLLAARTKCRCGCVCRRYLREQDLTIRDKSSRISVPATLKPSRLAHADMRHVGGQCAARVPSTGGLVTFSVVVSDATEGHTQAPSSCDCEVTYTRQVCQLAIVGYQARADMRHVGGQCAARVPSTGGLVTFSVVVSDATEGHTQAPSSCDCEVTYTRQVCRLATAVTEDFCQTITDVWVQSRLTRPVTISVLPNHLQAVRRLRTGVGYSLVPKNHRQKLAYITGLYVKQTYEFTGQAHFASSFQDKIDVKHVYTEAESAIGEDREAGCCIHEHRLDLSRDEERSALLSKKLVPYPGEVARLRLCNHTAVVREVTTEYFCHHASSLYQQLNALCLDSVFVLLDLASSTSPSLKYPTCCHITVRRNKDNATEMVKLFCLKIISVPVLYERDMLLKKLTLGYELYSRGNQYRKRRKFLVKYTTCLGDHDPCSVHSFCVFRRFRRATGNHSDSSAVTASLVATSDVVNVRRMSWLLEEAKFSRARTEAGLRRPVPELTVVRETRVANMSTHEKYVRRSKPTADVCNSFVREEGFQAHCSGVLVPAGGSLDNSGLSDVFHVVGQAVCCVCSRYLPLAVRKCTRQRRAPGRRLLVMMCHVCNGLVLFSLIQLYDADLCSNVAHLSESECSQWRPQNSQTALYLNGTYAGTLASTKAKRVRFPVWSFPDFHTHLGIVPGDATGRWVFSGSPVPQPLHSDHDPYSFRFALIGSQDLDCLFNLSRLISPAFLPHKYSFVNSNACFEFQVGFHYTVVSFNFVTSEKAYRSRAKFQTPTNEIFHTVVLGKDKRLVSLTQEGVLGRMWASFGGGRGGGTARIAQGPGISLGGPDSESSCDVTSGMHLSRVGSQVWMEEGNTVVVEGNAVIGGRAGCRRWHDCQRPAAAVDRHRRLRAAVASVIDGAAQSRCILEKTRRAVASSATIPTCEKPGVTRLGIEPGSSLSEASSLTTQPLRPYRVVDLQNRSSFAVQRPGSDGDESYSRAYVRKDHLLPWCQCFKNVFTNKVVSAKAVTRSIITVVRLPATNLGEPGSIPGGAAPGLPHVGTMPDDAAGQCHFFSGISLSHPLLHSRAAPYAPRFTLISSQDLEVKALA
ncbi:hypothetical protein PR048_015346 [Dryococelus australis]|uniref:Uncharacterized protein n=1 Tax=Dryococelus australis TaxID=614101 RepID=A0ABQ9HGQ3_9NEOP|nr:hypothetical protein PR048_015346 [Dryococelus australis]